MKFKVPAFHADGTRKGIIVISRDITERKKMEKALKEAEAKYRSLVEDALVGVFMFQNGKLVYVNPRYAEIFGYTQDELLTMDVIDLFHGDDKQFIQKAIEQRLNNQISSPFQIRGVRKDKKLIDIETHRTLTIYNGQPVIIGTNIDISERKRNEELVKKTDKFL